MPVSDITHVRVCTILQRLRRERFYFFSTTYSTLSARYTITCYHESGELTIGKLAADSELSVKNGAELLDRLIKDIVSESAATYVSFLQPSVENATDPHSSKESTESLSADQPTAFSLAKFIPLLQERIYVINPFTRTFLVSWVTLLDTIPDLELVSYLPSFLGGLFKFLSDPNRDVHIATQGALERFLNEIKKIARIKRGIAESRRGQSDERAKHSNSSDSASVSSDHSTLNEKSDTPDAESGIPTDGARENVDSDWVPGQDVQVDHSKIMEILVTFLDSSSGTEQGQQKFDSVADSFTEEEIQLTALRWIDSFFEICPDDILAFVPRLLSQVLPAMASGADLVRQAANRVNSSLMEHIVTLPDESIVGENSKPQALPRAPTATNALKDAEAKARRASTPTSKQAQTMEPDTEVKKEEEVPPLTPPSSTSPTPVKPTGSLDYAAAVGALTLHFLNEHEATRVASLAWLLMLHRRAPNKVLATNDGTFPALLKTLSDPAEAVVTRDLQLLSQISKNSDDGYFTSFMVNLLQLFCTDRRLLETRGNLIIRQLCVNLSAERIYRVLADCLEKDEVSRDDTHCHDSLMKIIGCRVC